MSEPPKSPSLLLLYCYSSCSSSKICYLQRLPRTMNKTCTWFEYGRGGRWEPDAKAGSASRFYTLTMLKLSVDNAFMIVLNLD
ncbi:hypothetical protein ACFX2H_023082 [Malus domestica]